MPNQQSDEFTPVLIIGAGPTGLNLSNLLLQYGIHHRIVEKRLEVTRTSNALIIQPRILEMWDCMGIADKFIARGKAISNYCMRTPQKVLHEIDFSHTKVKTKYPFVLGLPQSETEAILSETLEENGGNVERGVTLIDYSQTDKAVTAYLKHSTGEIETVKCEWLVAADGSHSTVRKISNIPFYGSTFPDKFILLDAEISSDLNPESMYGIFTHIGPMLVAPMQRFTRFICEINPENQNNITNLSLTDIEQIINQRMHTPVKIIKQLWSSHFITHCRLINNFRYKRVFFAGDSAHIHSPVGAQGMNTGLQDSHNLAWKIAFVSKKQTAIGLLNSYNQERRQVAKKVLRNTSFMRWTVTVKNTFLIFLRNHIFPFILSVNKIKSRLLLSFSQIGISYQKHKKSLNQGKRAPDVELRDTYNQCIHLYKLLHGLKYKLLIFTGKNPSAKQVQQISTIIEWIDTHPHKSIDIVLISSLEINFSHILAYKDQTLEAHKAYLLKQGGICLVRPDQYIELCSRQIDLKKLLSYILLKSPV
jgi:2-polyprenyl-6-methoxyphenol hydroxylase-like FAD-dependent oxidoreductase